MTRKLLLLFFIISINSFVFSQSAKLVRGKILCEDIPVQGIQILNLVSEKSSISDENGNFSILAKANEMLVFISLNYDYKRKFLAQSDIDLSNFTIILTRKINELDEVIVTKNPKLNAVNLGILSKPAKEYSPAERRLKTAGDFKPIQLLGLLGGQLPLDPIINAITGRTKMLKNNLKIERNQILLAKLENQFEDDYYINGLKINKDYIKAFQYYIIEDKEFLAAWKSKNKSILKFTMTKLAINFNKIIAYENK